MAEQQREDIVSDIDEFVQENTLVAICNYGGSDNCYLSYTIATGLDVQTYAGGGDRAVRMSESTMPRKIRYVQNATNAVDIANNIIGAAKFGLCDYVLLPYFDLRHDVDSWPPDPNSAEFLKKKEIASVVAWRLRDLYPVYQGEYYTVVDTAPGSHTTGWTMQKMHNNG